MKKNHLLTREQFDYIVTECDAVLAKHTPAFSVAGIAWLNVLHSHPSIQARYVHVFHKRTTAAFIAALVKGTGVLVKNILLSLLQVFNKKQRWKNLPLETDVLFISHLLNVETFTEGPDFYFQDLPEYLQAHGFHTAVGLMNHVKGFAGLDRGSNRSHTSPEKFLLPDRLNFGTEMRLIGRCIKTAAFFFKQYLEEKEPLKRSFLFELAGNSLSSHTLRAFRMYESIRTILRYTDTKVLAFTWEGHSWEKMVCHAAKTAAKKILCIGYQHTILYPTSHSIKKAVNASYNPDIILTVGSVTRDLLLSSPGLAGVKIKTYGSPRLHSLQEQRVVKQIQKGCLVTPDGIIDECILLFVFAIKTAQLMPETDFIFRTHPAINFSDLQKQDERLHHLPPNVILSGNKNINDDFSRCSWLLYRVSSVSFFAVLAGLRPVYVHMENEIMNDVLYALNSWRKQVVHPESLLAIIETDKQTVGEDLYKESQEAYDFCKAYMVPYHKPIFEQCILEEMSNG